MPTVTATPTLYARLSPWLVGIVGFSEVGETTTIGGTLTDITADTRIGVQPIEVSYGIQSSGPLDRVAETGTIVFALDNSSSNSTGNAGAYSPGHTNAIAGWDIGVDIILKITYSGTDYYKFAGTLVSIEPDAGQYQRRAVICTGVDWMDEAALTKVRSVTIQTDKRSDELIQLLVEESISKQPLATSYSEGQSTFDIAFDNLLDAQTSVIRALSDCVISELGYLYIKGDTTQGGTLTFEDRHARPKKGTASGSFDNTMSGLSVKRDRSDIINTVYVVVHPRTTADATSVLYELTTTGTTPSVPAAKSITINCPYRESSINAYRVAAATIETPLSGTDWVANSAADGSGSNQTSSVTVTVETQAANAVTLNIANSHATIDAYLTTLQVRGTSIKDVTETVMSANNESSAFTYGEKDARIDMKYESNAGEFGNEIAKWILNVYKDARYVIKNFELASNSSTYLMTQSLAREPGDKITLAEAMTGIVETVGAGQVGFFINGVNITIDAGGIITTNWALAPASQSAAWVLEQVGASELGLTTNLGFA
jgi:hypothetical protein